MEGPRSGGCVARAPQRHRHRAVHHRRVRGAAWHDQSARRLVLQWGVRVAGQLTLLAGTAEFNQPFFVPLPNHKDVTFTVTTAGLAARFLLQRPPPSNLLRSAGPDGTTSGFFVLVASVVQSLVSLSSLLRKVPLSGNAESM